MDNFTIHYDAYFRVCKWRSENNLGVDSVLLGILFDMRPRDKAGFTPGLVEITADDLWKRRMLKVPANLTGTLVRIIYN